MKKLIAIVLCLAMVFCMAACGQEKAEQTTTAQTTEQTATVEQEVVSSFPEEDVNCIVPYSAGGGTDLMIRAVAQNVDLGSHTMVVTNITGGNALTGSEECFNAEPDGYTLVSVAPEAWIAQYMSKTLTHPLYSELTPICVVAEDPNVLAVSASSGWANLEDFLAYAKSAGKNTKIASTSKGGSNEFFTYGLAEVCGFEFTYVPYSGGSESRTSVLGGENDAVVCQVSEIKSLVDSGDMIVLGVAAEEQSPYVAGKTFKEQGYDIIFGLHRSIWSSPDTDSAAYEYLVKALETACNSDSCKETLESLGYTPAFCTGEELAAKTDDIAKSLEKWSALVE